MNSVAGNKDRIAVTTRSRKYGVTEPCSPTKPAAPFSPESWYRKAYEESRAGSRPAPEGAGSVLGSSGTPSPGSGTSSPGSFSGSPGPASPGIGSTFSSVIHDKLQVPNTIRKAWNERDNRCDVCATHLNQLKQEAIQMVLTLEQAANTEQYDASPGSPPPLSNIPTLVGSRHMGSLQPRDWAYMPTSYTTANYTGFVANKHSGKPNNLGIINGLEKKNGSPGHQAKVSLQMATSPSNGNILNSVAIQAHQYLDGTWSLSRTNGVTLYPYQISQLMTETSREGLTEAVLNRYNADKPSLYSFPASQSTYVASETSTGTSVAASFFAR
uniref:Kinesin-like protein KIF26A/B helical domain-containing protein n=1 Tax=Gopherus evgoodei TaxID=1825980 RepID=A0A8C4W5C4_9SAUR